MGNTTIGAKIALDGEEKYRKAIAAINKDMGVLASELSLVTEKFKGNANGMEALQSKNKILTEQYEIQKKKMEETRKALEHAEQNYLKTGQRVDQLKQSISKATETMEEMKQDSSKTKEELADQQKVIDELNQELKQAEGLYQKCDNKVDQWQISLNDAERKLYSLDGEIKKNKTHMEEAERSTDQTASSIDEYGKEVVEASRQTSVFGDVLKANLLGEAIVTGVKAVAGAVKEISKSVITMGADFETAMSQVAATMGMTADQIENGCEEYELLKKAAEECGAKTKYSATQAGEALNYLALAGYDARKAAETLPKVLDLAAAGGMDLAYASDLVTDSMSALGLETDYLTTFMDQMAKTSQKSNTNVAQLGEGILTVGGTAKYLAGGTKELNTELGILADNGIKGAEGGTALRNMILSLAAPTDKAAASIKDLKLEVFDTSGKMRPLNEIFADLNDTLSTMSEGRQVQVLNSIFNKVDLKSVNALMANSVDRFQELSTEIENCDGAAKTMAETMSNNLKGKTDNMNSAIEGLAITAYDKFEGMFKRAVDAAAEGVGNLNKELSSGDLSVRVDHLADSMGDAAEGILDFAQDAVPVMIDGLTWILDNGNTIASVLGGIGAGMLTLKAAEGIQSATIAIRGMKTAIDAAAGSQAALNLAQMANPAGLVAAAVVGLTAAVIIYNQTTEKAVTEAEQYKKECEDLGEKTAELAQNTGELAEKRKDAAKGAEQESREAQILADKLYELNEKASKTNQEKQQMSFLVDELNQRIPSLSLNLEEETGALNKQKSEVDGLIRANRDLYMVKALEEDYTVIAEKQAEAEKALYEAEQQRAEGITKKEEAQKRLNEAMAQQNREMEQYGFTYSDVSEKVNQYQKEIDDLNEGILQTDVTIKNANLTIQRYGEEWEKTDRMIAEHTGVEETKQEVEVFGETVEASSQEAADAITDMLASYNQALSETEKSIHSSMGLFDEFSNKTKISGKTLLENLQSQIDGMDNWQKNINELSGRCSEEFVQELKDMGLGAAGEVAALNAMSDDELKKYVKLWEDRSREIKETAELTHEAARKGIEEKNEEIVKSTEEASQAAVKALDKSEESKKAGFDFAGGFAIGLQNGSPAVITTAKILSEAALKASKNQLQIKSPSRRVRDEIGLQYSAGFAAGIEKGKYKVMDAVSDLGKMSLDKAKEFLEKYTVYHDMTLKEEVVFWEQMQKQYKKGSKERLEIDKNYLSAKETLNNQLASLDRSYADSCKKVNEDLKKDIDSLTNKYEESVNSRANAITGAMSLFEAFQADKEVTGQEMVTNLQTQIDGLVSWTDTLGNLRERIGEEGLLSELQQMGPGALKELQALNTLTDAELDRYVQMWKEKNRLAREEALQELEPLREETAGKIKEAMEAAAKELKKQKEAYYKQLEEIGVTLFLSGTNEIENQLNAIGKQAVEGLSSSAEKAAKSKKVTNSLTSVNKTVTGTMGKMKEQAYTIGAGITGNLIDGMNSRKAELQNALNDIMHLTAAAQGSQSVKETTGANGKVINQEFNIYAGTAPTAGAMARVLKQSQREAAMEL